MSGVTFVGIDGGASRFLVIQDSMGLALDIRVSLLADGAIASAAAVDTIPLGVASDYEGVAFSNPLRNSMYLADESAASIHEIDLATGHELQRFELPDPFGTQRSNFGLESLTQATGGRALWTANEQALSVDGPLATSQAGTTVRLVEVIVSDAFALSPGRQFAYEVEAVHGIHSPSDGSRSGLVDLVSLPDGGLLSLERSLAFDPQTSLPAFESRIYEVQFADATDISDTPFLAGLDGMAYVPVGKRLLWRGQAGGFLGQNLEGLALGPMLEGGTWSLLGVVDDGDPLSGDTVVAFELIRGPQALAGDYNGSGRVEQGDLDLVLLHWGEDGQWPPAGWTGPAPLGIIDQRELDGVLLHWGQGPVAAAVPEPHARQVLAIAASMVVMAGICRRGPIFLISIGLDSRSDDEVQ